MLLLGFLLLIGFAILLYYLARGGNVEEMIRRSHKGEDPLEIAKRRYACGEITREEFERMKKDLEE